MFDFKIYAQVCIFYLSVVKEGKLVELTIIEGSLDGASNSQLSKELKPILIFHF